MEFFVSISSFFLILFVLIYFREKTYKIEIRNTDIIVAILPLFIYLLVSGKLSKFELSESGLEIETAITNAASNQISGLKQTFESIAMPVVTPTDDFTTSTADFAQLLQHKTEAVTFHLGDGGYSGQIIQQNIQQLNEKPYLKFLVFVDKQDKFFGIISSIQFARVYPDDTAAYQDLADWINQNSQDSLVTYIPDLLTVDKGLAPSTSRRAALAQMMALKADMLPVIDSSGQLTGMVDRAKVTTSLLLDIAASVAQ